MRFACVKHNEWVRVRGQGEKIRIRRATTTTKTEKEGNETGTKTDESSGKGTGQTVCYGFLSCSTIVLGILQLIEKIKLYT